MYSEATRVHLDQFEDDAYGDISTQGCCCATQQNNLRQYCLANLEPPHIRAYEFLPLMGEKLHVGECLK